MTVITRQNNTYIIAARDLERGDISVSLEFATDLLETCLETYDLLSFDTLKAELTIKPWRKTGMIIEGQLTARCEQKCVVSLKAVPQNIATQISQTFLPAIKAEPGLEIEIDIDENIPDEFSNGELDLVPFVLEHFALELDLYPRAMGAEIDPQYQPPTEAEKQDEKPSPFAVLKDLKKPI